MRRIRLIIAIIVAVIVIAFSVANRQDIVFSFYPLPWAISLPLYLFTFLVFALGALTGGVATWAAALRRRRRAAQKAQALETQQVRHVPRSGPPMVQYDSE